VNHGPRIAYDARLCLGQYRGMGRFLRQLIAGHEQDFLGFCATGEQDPTLRLMASGYTAYPLWEQLSIPRLVQEHGVEVFLAPFNTAPLRLPDAVKLVLVVHDVIFMDNLPSSRSLYQNLGRTYRRLVVPRALRQADVVVTVTDFTAQQLESRFMVPSSRIRVIPNSIGEEWFLADDRPVTAQPYVFLVSGEAPSKNLSRAIEAFARCRGLASDSNLLMKVAGVKQKFHPQFQKEAARLGIADSVVLLPYVSDAEMRALHRHARLFVMPSLAEGFGIPVLEAMVSGVPVAASAGTCLEEVGGNAARYFDPTSVDDMARMMHQILAEPALQAEMVERGKAEVRRYHPDVVREKVRSFWAELEDSTLPATRWGH
jgi:glycosyltransferase involved in cell wall biosynthesis